MLDERFCRMWEFYMIACEHGLSHGMQMVFHLQFTKQVDRLPITRNESAFRETSVTQDALAS